MSYADSAAHAIPVRSQKAPRSWKGCAPSLRPRQQSDPMQYKAYHARTRRRGHPELLVLMIVRMPELRAPTSYNNRYIGRCRRFAATRKREGTSIEHGQHIDGQRLSRSKSHRMSTAKALAADSTASSSVSQSLAIFAHGLSECCHPRISISRIIFCYSQHCGVATTKVSGRNHVSVGRLP